ncbi:MAG: CDP-diacylglycerol--serine O-phosphatidyltransferase [Gammaproteobacteria bacterium]|nr:CDP-diacylglycerol--serine O-phosphatidyltransferase [Gammaproteobacteria bacterium]MDH3373770.1 CDP-diacylglycerol--serine O-phosphatidyltransferase [Gammaproteobacteria bacterium]MDH3410304.1 CDP-diacylglycerol--serine O-phosphatidyltransferase [Gammaproteobacteria bacterium]MDH3552314.1 CDP-diacylglycerol--serine O-phosphatidyltransferase [Gammaproteobacteria bacterium]
MVRLRYTIPNSFTALSLLLGLGSIVTTQVGQLEFAAWLIVWCGLLDTMDGLAARLLKATSSFGAEFDSMADLVSFGVAPAMLVFNAGLQIAGIDLESGQFWVLLTACGVFVLAGAMRLARFNLATDKPRTGWFTGVPITACGGGLVSSMILVLIHHDDIASLLPLHLYLPIIMFVFAILMVSRLRFPKAVIRKSMIVNVFMIANIAGIFVCGILRIFPEYLFSIGLFVLVAGIIAGRISRDD